MSVLNFAFFRWRVLANNLLLILISISIIFLRPSIIGERFGFVVVPMVIFLSFIYLYGKKFQITIKSKIMLVSIMIFIIYIAVQSLFTAIKIRPVLSSLSTLSILIPIFVLLTSENKFIIVFHKTLIILLVMLVVSSIITYLMQILHVEINFSAIQTHQNGAAVGKYASIYFPFSISGANKFYFNQDFSLERSFGIFREPGVYQMYLIYGYFLLSYNLIIFRYQKIFSYLMILGIFSTFSGAGIFSFLFLLIMRHILTRFNVKNLLILLLMLLLIIYFFNFLEILMNARIHSVSFSDRFGSLMNILKENELSLIFGVGYLQNVNDISTVNLLGSVSTIGLLGLILYLLPWANILFNFKVYKVILISPFFLTLLFAQPIYTDPIIFLILCISTQNFGKVKSG